MNIYILYILYKHIYIIYVYLCINDVYPGAITGMICWHIWRRHRGSREARRTNDTVRVMITGPSAASLGFPGERP